jgi:formiminotetrahydrofolate cyclodeaminase
MVVGADLIPHKASGFRHNKKHLVETLDTYLTELASSSATPGGGSAAMLVAATGAAQLAMVCRISAANPKFTAKKEAAERIVAEADRLRNLFLAARQRDEAAFEGVVAAQKLPKETGEQKTARALELEGALGYAAAVPLELAGSVLAVLRLTRSALDIENANLVSDLGCAAEFARAGFNACAYSVRINHKYMKNATAVAVQARQLDVLNREADELSEAIRERVNGALP